MNFYFVNGVFKNVPKGPAFAEALQAHHAYWAPFMQEGKVLFSGPKPAGAGVLVVKCENEEEVKAMIANDPFVLNGVAEFEPIEFKVFYKNPAAESWFAE